MGWLTTVLTLAFLLYLSGVGLMGSLSAYRLGILLREQIPVLIFLEPEMDSTQVAQRIAQWWTSIRVRHVEWIPPREGLHQLQAESPDIDPFLVDYNPLPHVVVLYLEAGVVHPDTLRAFRQMLESDPAIIDVTYEEWMVRWLSTRFQVLLMLIGGAVLLLLVATLLTIRNFVRLTLEEQRFLIKNMQAVGASWWWILRPYVWMAIRQGIVALILAGLGLAGTAYLLDQIQLVPVHFWVGRPIMLGLTSAILVLLALILPVMTTLLTTLRYLRVRTEELYER